MPEPRVLLSIDYEPWAALLQREYDLAPSAVRREVDNGYTAEALDDVLGALAGASVTIYLVGEIADWHPDVPSRIVEAGHELGFHGHAHRPLQKVEELKKDLRRSQQWMQQYGVKGYRAPIMTISREGYAALREAELVYSSSAYGPTGSLQRLSGICEVPVSTWSWRKRAPTWWWPRRLSMRLLRQGELPYGSSLLVGALGDKILKWVERDLNRGRSPVLVLHNYQVAPPPAWPEQIRPLLLRDPRQLAFVPCRRELVKRLIREFPVGPIDEWLECQHSHLTSNGCGKDSR